MNFLEDKLNRPFKNQIFFFSKILVFEWPIEEVFRNNWFLQGDKLIKKFTGGKTPLTCFFLSQPLQYW